MTTDRAEPQQPSEPMFTVGNTLRTSSEFPEGTPCVLVDGDSVYCEFTGSNGLIKAQHVAMLLNERHKLSEAMCHD